MSSDIMDTDIQTFWTGESDRIGTPQWSDGVMPIQGNRIFLTK